MLNTRKYLRRCAIIVNAVVQGAISLDILPTFEQHILFEFASFGPDNQRPLKYRTRKLTARKGSDQITSDQEIPGQILISTGSSWSGDRRFTVYILQIRFFANISKSKGSRCLQSVVQSRITILPCHKYSLEWIKRRFGQIPYEKQAKNR